MQANENNMAGGIAGPNEAGAYPDDGNSRVNERRYGADSPGRKVLVGVFIALMVLGIGVAGFFWVLRPLMGSGGEKTVEVKGSKKEFGLGSKPLVGPQASADCATVALTQANGQPLLGSDGAPITVDCNGKASSQVPAPNGLYQGAPANSGGQGQPKPPSKYRGSILLKDDTAAGRSIGMPALPAMPDLSALQGMLNRKQGGGLMGGNQGDGATAGGVRDVRGDVGGMLNVTATSPAQAGMLKDMPYLLPKGKQIDCALTTRIVSEVSGFASCVLTANVYSVDGKTLLLERGSEVDGEYQAGMKRGQRRLFVLWNRVRTPLGVYVNLASPNADALGTMGLPGYVDNKWFERIGSALLLSLVQDGMAAAVGGDSTKRTFDENGNVTSETTPKLTKTRETAESSVATVLADQIGIQPTLYANQGDRISIYVARDVDFRGVYARN